MVDKFPLRCACWEKCVVFVGWWNSLTALRAMTHSSLSWRGRSHAKTCLTLSQVCSPTQFIIFSSLFILVFKSDMEPCKVAPCLYCVLDWKVTPKVMNLVFKFLRLSKIAWRKDRGNTISFLLKQGRWMTFFYRKMIIFEFSTTPSFSQTRAG